jgi:hypothetical protein
MTHRRSTASSLFEQALPPTEAEPDIRVRTQGTKMENILEEHKLYKKVLLNLSINRLCQNLYNFLYGMIKMIEGSCLYGSVTWQLDGKPDGATACNCTACRRYGVLNKFNKD